MLSRPSNRHRRAWASAATTAIVLGLAACSSSSPSPAASGSARQTIVFAESGLGTEVQQTERAVSYFERANPGIHVKIDVLSPDSTTYLSQLEKSFTAGSATPDVYESDVTYPPKFARAGWALNLARFGPDMKRYFPAEAAAGTHKGGIYAIPWFDNPEGLYYRTDLIKTPPTSPAQVVADAKAAMQKDHALKEGLAFEGREYEGAITAFVTVESAFGSRLRTSNIDTAGNVAALAWLQDSIYKNHIAPMAVTRWEEGQVAQEFVSGRAAFAIDYPFAEVLATKPPVKGHVGYIPFPAGPNGTPSAAAGGEMLAINAKSAHAAAAWKLIQYLTSPKVETARAEATGDPPSLPGAYTPVLYAKAPYFENVKTLISDAQPRPVNPDYLTVSRDLQVMLAQVYAHARSAPAALSGSARAVRKDGNTNTPP